jgi:IS5 family transposase
MKSEIKQRTLAMMTGFERYTKKTRRAMFLEEMEQVVPWRKLCALIEPHYPKAGNGRRPVGVERMLRSGRGVVRLGDAARICGR